MQDIQRAEHLKADCLNGQLLWPEKHAFCLRKFAIWTSNQEVLSARSGDQESAILDVSTPASIEVTTQFMNTTFETPPAELSGLLTELEAQSRQNEWEGFLLFAIPTVFLLLFCVALGIVAYFLIERIHKRTVQERRSRQLWTLGNEGQRPSAPRGSFVSRPSYSREDSITSYVSLPPDYVQVTDGKAAAAEAASKATFETMADATAREDSPPSYEFAFNKNAAF